MCRASRMGHTRGLFTKGCPAQPGRCGPLARAGLWITPVHAATEEAEAATVTLRDMAADAVWGHQAAAAGVAPQAEATAATVVPVVVVMADTAVAAAIAVADTVGEAPAAGDTEVVATVALADTRAEDRLTPAGADIQPTAN